MQLALPLIIHIAILKDITNNPLQRTRPQQKIRKGKEFSFAAALTKRSSFLRVLCGQIIETMYFGSHVSAV